MGNEKSQDQEASTSFKSSFHFFEKVNTNNSTNTVQTIEKSMNTETKPKSLPLAKLPDAAEIIERNLKSTVFDKNLFIRFCSELNCEKLTSEDVINNQSFITGISNSCQSILKFMKGYDTFMASHSRTKQTNLYQSTVKVQENDCIY